MSHFVVDVFPRGPEDCEVVVTGGSLDEARHAIEANGLGPLGEGVVGDFRLNGADLVSRLGEIMTIGDVVQPDQRPVGIVDTRPL